MNSLLERSKSADDNDADFLKAQKEAQCAFDVMISRAYSKFGTKLKLSLYEKRQIAVIRAKYEQPLSRIGELLRACRTESIDAPEFEDRLINYYCNSYDWIDESAAIWLVAQLYEVDKETKGEIFYDRHFKGGRASDGKDGRPYESISFSQDIEPNDIMDYMMEYRPYVEYADDQDVNEKTYHWDFPAIRKIIVLDLYYRYCKYKISGKLTRNQILEVFDKVSSGEKYVTDEQKAKYTYARFNQDIFELEERLKKDPFREALAVFEEDCQKNKAWYEENGIGFDVGKNDCGVILADPSLMKRATRYERFDIEFCHEAEGDVFRIETHKDL